MKYFNFDSLIDKYSTEFTVVVTEKGHYENGQYKPGNTQEFTLKGAIIAFSERKVFRSEGTITEQDKVLYMKQPLERALHGAKLMYGEKEYRISDEQENHEFTGVYAYTLKFVSKFNEEGGGVQ